MYALDLPVGEHGEIAKKVCVLAADEILRHANTRQHETHPAKWTHSQGLGIP